MTHPAFNPNQIQPRRRGQLLLAAAVIAYGVFLGEIYSVVNFRLWLLTHALTLGLLGLGLLWPALKARHWPPTPLNAPLLAMAVTLLLSALLSAWPRLALEGLFVWLSHVLAFFLAVRLMQRGWADDVLRALLLVTGVVVLVACFELAAWYFGLPFAPQFSQGWWELGGFSHPLPPIWHRLSFSLSNPVIVSAFLVMTLPVALAVAVTTRRPADSLLVWAFVWLTLVVLAATKSRGGWLGLTAAGLTLLALWLRQRGVARLVRQRLQVALLAAAVILIALAIGAVFVTLSEGRTHSNAHRLAYWSAARQLFVENPLWGLGPGLYRWGWRQTSFAPNIEERVVTAHSLYFNHLVELGLVGGLAGLWLLAAAVAAGWRVLGQTSSRRLWWRRAGCAAGLMAFLAQGLVETFPIWPMALPGVILAAYLFAPAAALNLPAPRPLSAKFSRLTGPVLAGSWLVCALLLTFFAYPRWQAEQARQLARAGNFQAALPRLDTARRLDPHLTLYAFEQASWLAQPQVADYATAASLYRPALEREPTYAVNQANLAVIEWQLGQPDAAMQRLQQAVALAPAEPRFWLTLGNYAEQAHQPELAQSAYIEALRLNPAWLASDFWSATAWRRQQFAPMMAATLVALPPDQRREAQAAYYYYRGDGAAAARLLSPHPTSLSEMLLAAQIYLAQGDAAAALNLTQQAAAQWPADPTAPALQALSLIALGRLPEAEASLKLARFLGYGSGGLAALAAGQLAEAQGRPAAAIAAYQRSFSPPADALDYGVAVYRQLGTLTPLPQLERTSAGPVAAQGWLRLAELQRQSGQFTAAAQVYRALLHSDPYLTAARQALEALCQSQGEGCQFLTESTP